LRRIIEYIFEVEEEFCSPKVFVTEVLIGGTRHIKLVPFQVHHIGPYFGIIRTTKLYD
jgi:hypothetical protein